MKKYLYTAGLIFIIAIPVYLYASPYIALYQIKTAIDRQDYGRLSQFVDYDELRKDLMGKAGAIAARTGSIFGDGRAAGGVEASLKKQLVEQVAGQLITPDKLPVLIMQLMMRDGAGPSRMPGAKDGTAKTADRTDDFLGNAEFGYRSFNAFAITFKPKEQQPVTFVMHRRGLQWKLTSIDI